MLTEQDFLKVLDDELDSWTSSSRRNKIAKHLHSQHLEECERIAELAFNSARELLEIPDYASGKKHKYRTFQDFKESLKTL